MPKGPKGERRPADVIGAAIMVGRIATGEIQEAAPVHKSSAAELGSQGGWSQSFDEKETPRNCSNGGQKTVGRLTLSRNLTLRTAIKRGLERISYAGINRIKLCHEVGPIS